MTRREQLDAKCRAVFGITLEQACKEIKMLSRTWASLTSFDSGWQEAAAGTELAGAQFTGGQSRISDRDFALFAFFAALGVAAAGSEAALQALLSDDGPAGLPSPASPALPG